jgi:hypothetical protein
VFNGRTSRAGQSVGQKHNRRDLLL